MPKWLKYGLVLVVANFFLSFVPGINLLTGFLNSSILIPFSYFFPKYYLVKSNGWYLNIYPVGWVIVIIVSFLFGALAGLIAEKKPHLLHSGVNVVFFLILMFMLFNIVISLR